MISRARFLCAHCPIHFVPFFPCWPLYLSARTLVYQVLPDDSAHSPDWQGNSEMSERIFAFANSPRRRTQLIHFYQFRQVVLQYADMRLERKRKLFQQLKMAWFIWRAPADNSLDMGEFIEVSKLRSTMPMMKKMDGICLAIKHFAGAMWHLPSLRSVYGGAPFS